jgi:ATP synthase protein I
VPHALFCAYPALFRYSLFARLFSLTLPNRIFILRALIAALCARSCALRSAVIRPTVDAMSKILILQGIIVAVVALAGFGHSGVGAAGAVLFGGTIAMVNAGLLGWRLQRGARLPHVDLQRHMKSFYASSLERFVAVAALLAIGMGILKLMPLALLAGFIAGQLAFMLSGHKLGKR